jgi:cytochrome c peroxidase
MTHKYHVKQLVVFVAAMAVFSVTGMRAGEEKKAAATRADFKLPKDAPAPSNNQVTPERAELGKMLFFDPRLSGSNWISCASCHNPALGWSDGLPTAIGNGMQVLGRRTPSIVNSSYGTIFMWDGRFHSLEEQAWGPMLAAGEMHGAADPILQKLKQVPGYPQAFERAYPGEGITKDTVAKAIASFERTIVSSNSPFDSWTAGDEAAMSPAAKRGFELFIGKANCVACHQGANFTDQGFHNIGLKDTQDVGRYEKIPVPAMKGAFKTPSLRDVALRAPYMHNGMYRTLQNVVDHYDRAGDEKGNLDANLHPLGLSSQEKQDLVEFMRALTGDPESVTVPRLPQ